MQLKRIRLVTLSALFISSLSSAHVVCPNYAVCDKPGDVNSCHVSSDKSSEKWHGPTVMWNVKKMKVQYKYPFAYAQFYELPQSNNTTAICYYGFTLSIFNPQFSLGFSNKNLRPITSPRIHNDWEHHWERQEHLGSYICDPSKRERNKNLISPQQCPFKAKE